MGYLGQMVRGDNRANNVHTRICVEAIVSFKDDISSRALARCMREFRK